MDELAATLPDAAQPEPTPVDPDAELLNALNDDGDSGESTETEQPEEKFKVKINGEERELTRQEALSRLQKELAADQKFEEAAKLRKEAEDAITNREQYTVKQQQLSQALEYFNAQVQALASEGMPTQEQMQYLLENEPHEYLKWTQRIQQRQAQIQQAQNAQAQLRQMQAQEQSQALEKQRNELALKLPDVIPEWKDIKVAEKELTEIRDYIKTQGYSDQDWQNLTTSRAENFALLKKAMLYDKLIQKANQAKQKPPVAETANVQPITTLGSKSSATAKSIFDPNLSDEEYSRLRRQQRRKA